MKKEQQECSIMSFIMPKEGSGEPGAFLCGIDMLSPCLSGYSGFLPPSKNIYAPSRQVDWEMTRGKCARTDKETRDIQRNPLMHQSIP
ncbi:uncharacterized protein ACNS7B_005655 isoform 2-T2 [Menidia menidia]